MIYEGLVKYINFFSIEFKQFTQCEWLCKRTFSLGSLAAFSFRTKSPCNLISSKICSRVCSLIPTKKKRNHFQKFDLQQHFFGLRELCLIETLLQLQLFIE